MALRFAVCLIALVATELAPVDAQHVARQGGSGGLRTKNMMAASIGNGNTGADAEAAQEERAWMAEMAETEAELEDEDASLEEAEDSEDGPEVQSHHPWCRRR
eukprot:CAMPEP_0197873816 /NCGR_PEP_ID=MMETSP1439-20131203/3490_1 /TAXON_ID=66791 /ORGANISM="Gonyaulax spinifera, Strain CCMP409" /LENGTH=102 /DNA_ID=CAMNT_0043492883 /DNA_START=58 /DNA_END=363 /DNA_ORIENTATION=-